MNKLIPATFLIIAVLALPELGHARTNIYSRAVAQKEKSTPVSGAHTDSVLALPELGHARTNIAVAQKEKSTPVSGAHADCKKYFPLIGELITVPCK